MAMTWNEMVDLLTMLQAHDSRTVGDVDVRAWLQIAQLEGWKNSHAQMAVAVYHQRRDGKPRMTPGDVTDIIRAARKDISARLFTRSIEPPRELGGDVAAEMRWRRETVPALVDQHLDDWATTGVMPTPTNEIEPSSPAGQARLAQLIGRANALPAGI